MSDTRKLIDQDDGGLKLGRLSSAGSSSLVPDFSAHLDDQFLSDFQLRLVNHEGATLAQFAVHAIILCGQSDWFKSLLRNWMGDSRVFSITIADDELPAARQMLQCAYSNSMPDDADAQQLLATMILADRYGLRVCVEACKMRLLALDSKAIPWATAIAMLCLPPGLREGDAFASLTEKAHARVWESFRNLDEAWTNRLLRHQWLQLPLEAVERVLASEHLVAASENVLYVCCASWLAVSLKQHGSDPHQRELLAAVAQSMLGATRFPLMTGNFLAAVASHHGLLAGQPELPRWLCEAMQWAKASEAQRRDMEACASHARFSQRVGGGSPPGAAVHAAASAFTSYIAASDLQQAISKYRASSCSEAYYLLTAGHFYNGFTWRLKLTVKPPDAGSANDMNIHVGLCWGIEVEGEGALPLAESAMVQVDFDIATFDFVQHEEDATSSDGPVIIKAGTCWGWDDFFGPEVYADPSAWSKFMTERQQGSAQKQQHLLLSCHLYGCA